MNDPTSTEVGIRRSTIHLGKRRLELRHGDFTVHFFRDLARGESAMAIVCGELGGSAPILARVHSSCLTSECLMGRDCDCAEQLDRALASMAEAGAGVLFYLMQEGRGAGLTAKARDRMIVQASRNRVTTFEAYREMGLPPDLRRYDVIAPMSRLLSIRAPISLLTNNPEKATAVSKFLAEEGIEVCRTESIHGPTSAFNSDYLSAKHDSGHALERPDGRLGALPPERVPLLPPVVLPGDPNRILTASYFLPISLDGGLDGGFARGESRGSVEWFRLGVVFDCETARESIFMTAPSVHPISLALAGPETRRVVDMSLLDRLPIPRAPGREALLAALREIHENGDGAVRVRFDDRDRAER
jgi:3,4-dihydroxy 2-butanone 4-phosphate synthase/GTP cyclohydrolase II